MGKTTIKTQIAATYKSLDTEEWLDTHFNRPIGYLWALFFQRLGVHPNVVTILSIFLGVAGACLFYFDHFWYNLIGVLLFAWANFFDSCDGQLARMTGKKTRWGRILDGFAGDVWFVAVYLAIILRLMNQNIPGTSQPWSFWIFLLCAFAGIVCHASQCRLADYYRNIHLYFLKGASSELDTSAQQQAVLDATPRKGNFWWRAFLFSYIRYTRAQEKATPRFQQLIEFIRNDRDGAVSDEFRDAFRQQSLPLMKYANFLTFNWRAITLYASCLLHIPWLYPVLEITLFSFVAHYMHGRHERMSQRFYEQLKNGQFPS